MTPAEAVRAYLLTLVPVTTLVNARIWTFRLPQKPTLPAVLVQQISEVQYPHLRGTSLTRWARIQVDVIADTVAEARAVDQAILGDYVAGLPTGLRGATAQIASPGPEMVQALADSYREWWDADELKQARVTRDYRVWLTN